jgi:hypothetical protein
MTTIILLVVVLWILACASSLAAIVFTFAARIRHLWWAIFLAVTATVISMMGLTGRTPFGFFPEIDYYYTWASGASHILVRSGWLFVVPLVLGAVALVMAIWKHKRLHHAA